MRRPPAEYLSRAERIDRRVSRLYAEHPEMPAEHRAEVIAKIRDEERRNIGQRVVHGFDLTFKPPKSASALWAVADHGIQVQLYEAHQAAIEVTLQRIQDEALRTRAGAQGVRRVRTRGLIGAAFDHWDSRAADPLLHTHVTVPNRVQGPDGVWRTIDSRGLYKSVVAFSEFYDAAMADEITRRLAQAWSVATAVVVAGGRWPWMRSITPSPVLSSRPLTWRFQQQTAASGTIWNAQNSPRWPVGPLDRTYGGFRRESDA